MVDDNLSAEDRIRKVRIFFLREYPFFANIAMYFTLIEDEHIPTMGVNAEGDLHFNPEFVKKYNHKELTMIIAHETLHMALLHLVRVGSRDHFIWNIATDLAINLMLQEQGFRVPSEFLLNRRYNGMCAEEIYDKLCKDAKKFPMNNRDKKDGQGLEDVSFGDVSGKRFDEHYFPNKDPNGKPMSENEVKKLKNEWRKRIVEAETIAKQMGKMPEELERLFGKIIDTKINWKALLYRYITQEIPYDCTYARPSKRSESTGIYMPYQLKENIDIIVAIDSSGSISNDDMTDFMSEMIGISKSFSAIRMTVLVCDAKIQSVQEVSNGFSPKDVKLAGGGGTDFRPVFKWIVDNKPNAKLLIYFTDACGEFPHAETIKTLWVLPNDYRVPFGEKIVFKGE
jgi:predicted metal-dependent peptidase